MKKRNLLLVLFLAAINTAFSQTNTTNPSSESEKAPQNEVQSEKPVKVEKSTVTNKTVKVEAIKLEKKEAVIVPKEKVIIEEKDEKKKKSVKF